jgi:general secretion pathway protein E
MGYRGRTGIYEIALVDDSVRELILNRAMAFEIRKHCRKTQNMLTLREEALIKAVQGVTSGEEVLEHTEKFDDF